MYISAKATTIELPWSVIITIIIFFASQVFMWVRSYQKERKESDKVVGENVTVVQRSVADREKEITQLRADVKRNEDERKETCKKRDSEIESLKAALAEEKAQRVSQEDRYKKQVLEVSGQQAAELDKVDKRLSDLMDDRLHRSDQRLTEKLKKTEQDVTSAMLQASKNEGAIESLQAVLRIDVSKASAEAIEEEEVA